MYQTVISTIINAQMLNNMIGNLRALLRIIIMLFGTLLLITIQFIYILPRLLTGTLPENQSPIVQLWYRFMLSVMSIKVDIIHKKNLSKQQVFFLANHSSYIDILVLGAYFNCFFVAKSDIAGWPIFGFLSKIGGTLFITRERRFVKEQLQLLKTHIIAKQNLLVFPEGTTTNGREIIRFKSSLLNCAYTVDKPPVIQPLTIAYTHLNGAPISDQKTVDQIAWYGNMDMPSHLMPLLKQKSITVRVSVEKMLHASDFETPKDLVQQAQEQIENSFYKMLGLKS